MKSKIALILNETSGVRSLSTFPSVYNTAYLLGDQYDVDLFLPSRMVVDCNAENIRIVRLKTTKPPIIGIFLTLIFQLRNYDILIGYHATELIVSAILGTVYKIPYVYFCLEIIDFDQVKGLLSKIKKRIEVYFNKRASLTIVQDESRKKLIRSVNNLSCDHVIMCVPNSYIGTINKKSGLLRSKFNIPSNKIIILYAGGIESWALDTNLIRAVKKWDRKYILVLHGWCRDGYLQTLKPLIEKINREEKRIFLSLETLRPEEYSELIASADVGLAWAKRNSPNNVATIGLSSGKFASYLRCGIPVIVPSYINDHKNYVDNCRIGVSVNSAYAINEGVKLVMENYDLFRSNAFKFYSDHLEYEKQFNSSREYLKTMLTHRT